MHSAPGARRSAAHGPRGESPADVFVAALHTAVESCCVVNAFCSWCAPLGGLRASRRITRRRFCRCAPRRCRILLRGEYILLLVRAARRPTGLAANHPPTFLSLRSTPLSNLAAW